MLLYPLLDFRHWNGTQEASEHRLSLSVHNLLAFLVVCLLDGLILVPSLDSGSPVVLLESFVELLSLLSQVRRHLLKEHG
jgi:uncharacterized membrane protein